MTTGHYYCSVNLAKNTEADSTLFLVIYISVHRQGMARALYNLARVLRNWNMTNHKAKDS